MTAQEIKELRKALNLSQHELAQKIGVTAITVWRWENGKASPRNESVRKMKGLINLNAVQSK